MVFRTSLLLMIIAFHSLSADIFDDIRHIEEMGAIQEGSPEETTLFSFIEDRLNGVSISYTKIHFDDQDFYHSFSSGIVATIEGREEGSELLIAASTEGGVQNLASLLDAAESLSLKPPRTGVKLLFLGGEEGEEPHYPIGTKTFLETYIPPPSTALLYLNTEMVQRPIRVRNITGKRGIPLNLVKAFIKSGREVNISVSTHALFFASLQIYPVSPVDFYRGAGIPSLFLDGGWDPRITDIILNMAEISDEWKGDSETHYIALSLGKEYFIVREWVIILVFFLGMLFLFTFFLYYSKHFLINIMRFRKRLVFLLPVIFLLFVIFFIATLMVEQLLLLFQNNDLHTELPFYFILLKAGIILLLSHIFLFIANLDHAIPSQIYTYAAVFFSFATTFSLIIIDIIATPFALWIILWCLLAITVRSPLLKKMFFLILLIPYLAGLFYSPFVSSNLLTFLLLSRIKGNVFFFLALSPLLLFFFSLRRRNVKSPHSFRREIIKGFVIPGFFIALSLLVIISLVFPIEERRAEVSIIETRNYDKESREVIIKGRNRLPTGVLTIGEDSFLVSSQMEENSFRKPYEPTEKLIGVNRENYRGTSFYTLLIDHEEKISSIDFIIKDEGVTPLYCNFPYVVEGGDTMRLFIGVNPPQPLSIDFALLREENPVVEVSLALVENPAEISLPFDAAITTELILSDHIILKEAELN